MASSSRVKVVLLSYERLRDEITDRIEEIESTLAGGELTQDEMKELLSSLLRERELMVEEIDDLREERYGWVSKIQGHRNAMKLRINELDEGTYNSLESAADRLNVSVGRLLNEIMALAVEKETASGEFPRVSSKDLTHMRRDKEPTIKIGHVRDLLITGADLDGVDTKVRLSHIGSLEFDASVRERQFLEKVGEINHCRLVKLPGDFSRLLAYAKSSFCGYFEFATSIKADQQARELGRPDHVS